MHGRKLSKTFYASASDLPTENSYCPENKSSILELQASDVLQIPANNKINPIICSALKREDVMDLAELIDFTCKCNPFLKTDLFLRIQFEVMRLLKSDGASTLCLTA